nr:concanavalin A-like lectin/glucanase, subgroup [Tanacetum cinerariifolium]
MLPNLAGTRNLDSGRSQSDPGYCTREQLEDLKRQHALEKEEQRKAFESQQNALKIFVDFFNREQGTSSLQFEIPDLYTPQVFPCSLSTPGGPSSTSPSPSSTPLGLGNCYTPTFDPETSQSGEQDDIGSDDGNREYDVDIYDDDVYQRNLDNALSSLTSDTSIRYGFYNRSIGQNPDQANAIGLCKGDVQPDDCRSTLMRPFWGVLDTTSSGWFAFNPGNASNVAGFNEGLDRLLDQLRNDASKGGSLRKYASNSTSGPNFTTLYGLMQCTPDLSENDCYNCLDRAIREIPNCCDSKRGARYYYPSCNMRYEETRFYNDTVTLELPSPPPPTTQSSPPPPPPSGTGFTTGLLVKTPIKPMRSGYVREMFNLTIVEDTISSGWFAFNPGNASNVAGFNEGLDRLLDQLRNDASKGNNSNTTIVVIAVVASISLVILVVVFVMVLIRRKRKIQVRPPENLVDEDGDIDDISTVESLQYSFGIIKEATDNFSENNKLGQGGFGLVYKGKLKNGQEIAVKRLSRDSGQGDLEFKNEVLLLARLQHRNLVRLLGFSLEGSERLLMYEFVQNASLDQFIFGKFI